MNTKINIPDDIKNLVDQHVNNPIIKTIFGYNDLNEFVISALEGFMEADLENAGVHMGKNTLQEVYQ